MTASSRRMAIGFIAGATTLSMASAAFACTAYLGKMTVSDYIFNPVTGTDTTQVQSVSADGSGGQHAECPIPPQDAITSNTGSFVYGRRPAPIDLNGNFTVSVGKTTTCAPLQAEKSLADRVPTTYTVDGTWDVRWLNMTLLGVPTGVPSASDPTGPFIKPWCFNDVYPSTVVGSLSVSTSGGVASGSGTATQPAGTAGIGIVQICVDKNGADRTDLNRPAPPSLYLEVV